MFVVREAEVNMSVGTAGVCELYEKGCLRDIPGKWAWKRYTRGDNY